jgi:hypothetical protein
MKSNTLNLFGLLIFAVGGTGLMKKLGKANLSPPIPLRVAYDFRHKDL